MAPSRMLCLGAVACLHPTVAVAQGIVSARAGLVHYSEGRVLLNEKPIVQKASQFEEVRDGEYLRTERGRSEVLLSPGIFLRLGEDSQIQMISGRLTDIRFRLLAGAAVVEVDEIGKDIAVTVGISDTQVQLIRTGIYRLDASEGEAPRLRVFAGEAIVTSNDAQYHVKAKKEIELAGNFDIRKFDAEDTDPLDRWSKRRASYLSAASLSAGRMAYNTGTALNGSSWLWNPLYGMYGFVPYRGVCWSPYGYGFYSPVAAYRVYNPPRPTTYTGGGGGFDGGPTRSYNSSAGYTSVGATSSGTSGVVATSAGSSVSQGGGAS